MWRDPNGDGESGADGSESVLPPLEAPPLPGWVLLAQGWRETLFLHWAVEPRAVAGLFPRGVRPDVLDGTTYVGVVAFRVPSTAVAGILPVGGFNEANVRLYSVDARGRQGVFFLSLDASSLHNVLAGRALAGIPYMWSDVSLVGTPGCTAGAVRRRAPGPVTTADWRVRVGRRLEEVPRMERFVTARWGLHTEYLGTARWIRVEHETWPLHRADVLHYEGTLLDAVGVDVGGRPPESALWSPGVMTGIGAGERGSRG